MRTVDLSKTEKTLAEILALAREESVLIRTASGDDFLLSQADDLDREVAALGASERFTAFLDDRASEKNELSLDEVRRKHGMDAS